MAFFRALLALYLYVAASLVLADSVDLATARLVDLTHSFNDKTLYWPTSPSGFEFQQLAHGHNDKGYFYAANAFCTAEHGGTHLDAPIHFHETGQTADRIPLDRLIGPAVVIDVAAKAAADRAVAGGGAASRASRGGCGLHRLRAVHGFQGAPHRGGAKCLGP